MKYVPKRVIMWEWLSDERRDDIEEIERDVEYLEAELKENYIEIEEDKSLLGKKALCIFINHGNNYCYYDNGAEKRILSEIEKAGIDIEEVSIKFNEYIIREVIE